MTLYTTATRLRLATGSEVEAVVCRARKRARGSCLLVHGNPGTLDDWGELLPLLSDVLQAGGRSRFKLVPGAGHMLVEQRAREIADLLLRGPSGSPMAIDWLIEHQGDVDDAGDG